VQGGKDGLLRLLDRQNLAGPGAPGHLGGELQSIATPGGCPMLTQPAVWQEPGSGAIWLFATDSCATAAYQAVTAAGGATTLKRIWSIDQGATSPVVAGGVLFAATGGKLFALDPHTGRQLWSSADAGAGGSIGAIHWESPIVIGGRVYCPDQDGRVTAYGL
jgi:outer membrane protein assembly factor BamB